MMSAKGFLDPGPDNRPRMTAAQGHQVVKAVCASVSLHADRGEMPPDMAIVVMRITTEALAAYPTDRSCHTCDHLSSDHFCFKWDDDVPEEARETGCDKHCDELGFSVPF